MKKVSRRDFLHLMSLGVSSVAAAQLLSACDTAQPPPAAASENQPSLTPLQPLSNTPAESANLPTPTSMEYPYLVVTHGDDPEQHIRQGIKALGGMERFMKAGADVIIKPNICVPDRTYEYAATTNPWVVGALVKVCLEAGAKRVRVMDFPFGGPAEECYRSSGIQEQVASAGGEMEVMIPLKYKEYDIPDAVSLKKVSIYEDIQKADLLIDVPIAKTHGLAVLTLGLKNLMGTIEDRGSIHQNFDDRIVDLSTIVRPHLTIIDAIRTLMNNGPTGGNLNDVKLQNTMVFSQDTVTADSYASTLFGLVPQSLAYLVNAANRHLGNMHFEDVKTEEFNVSS
jgi:uncharacterized protein (DUF362 family)